MRKVGVLGCVCCVLAFLLISPALAVNTEFVLETFDDFSFPGPNGSIEPQLLVTGDPSLVAHYPDDTFYPATLYPYTGVPESDYDFGDPDGGLIMEWGTSADENAYAQWLYVYGEDPDLTGKVIKATVFAPVGINSISLSIIDAAGFSRSWDWNVGGGGPIPHNVLTPISISVQPAGAGGPGDATPLANSYFDNGVNPVTITTLGYDENGNWVAFNQVSPNGTMGPWNYWGRIQVTIPEPSTFVLLCMGAFGLLLNIRRGRK